MGCGILYRMVAEQIGLGATLATRRTRMASIAIIVMGVSLLAFERTLIFPVIPCSSLSWSRAYDSSIIAVNSSKSILGAFPVEFKVAR
jgi:hypothetical protein